MIETNDIKCAEKLASAASCRVVLLNQKLKKLPGSERKVKRLRV